MMPVTVLITGGIGSGKSAVSSILESEGIPVYDSDSRTKALYDSDLRLRENLESLLGVSLMAAVVAVKNAVIVIQHHQLNGGGADVDTGAIGVHTMPPWRFTQFIYIP